MEPYFHFFAGLALLIVGGDFLVKGAVSIARRFKMSPLLIGMTIVALGTSAPEFLVSCQAALEGHAEISLGNVIGSNIVNIGLIIGIAALISPLPVSRRTVKMDAPFMILCSVALFLMMENGLISRMEGIIMLIGLVAFIYFSFRALRHDPAVKANPATEADEPILDWWLAVVLILASCTALAFGSDLLIDGSTTLARDWGISERVISITMIALGTSLPELAASIMAAIRKQADIAIGNIIGSNIMNILFVLGVSATISPIRGFEPQAFQMDLLWMIGFAVLLSICILPIGRKLFKRAPLEAVYSTLGRPSGAVILCIYALYLTLLFV